MADDATADRAHNAVMTGIVAGDAAYNCAFRQPFASAEVDPIAETGIKASITAAIVANLITVFLCFKVGKSAGDLGSAWPLGKVQENTSLGQPRSRGKSLQFSLRAPIQRFSSQV